MEADVVTLLDLFRWLNTRQVTVLYIAQMIRLHNRECKHSEAHDRTRAALIAAVKRHPGMLDARVEDGRLRTVEMIRTPEKYKRFTATQLYYDTMHSPHHKQMLVELERCIFDFNYLGGYNGRNTIVARKSAGVSRSRRNKNAAALEQACVSKRAA